MSKFYRNPVVVKDNGVPFKIVEFSYDLGEDFSVIEIQDLSGKLIKKYELDDYTIISLEKNLGLVKFVYKTKNEKYIGEEVVDLKQNDGLKITLTEEESLYIKLKDIIKNKMDFPEGTDAEISRHTELLRETITNKNARTYVMSKIRKILITENLLRDKDIEEYAYRIYSDLYGMGVLQELDDDAEVGEIMVNAVTFPKFNSKIYYYKNHVKYEYDKEFENLESLKNVFSRAVEFNGKELNSVDNAKIEATRPNNDRVNVTIPYASTNWLLNIRKFSNFVPSLEMMRQSGTVDDYIDKLMKVLVKGKANIGIGGPMNTGKTTFINYLLTYTDPIERKVIIASVSETDTERVLKGHDIAIYNVDEEKGFTFENLFKSSLRTTAGRVIIPESRGGEFKQVYEANIKTKGNMFTGHALDDEGFLDVCCDMYMSSPDAGNESTEYIKNKLCKAIDVIIIKRKVGNQIRIKSISEVLTDKNGKYAGMNVLYEWVFDPENPLIGSYKRTENRLSLALKKRLNEFGVPMSMMKDL